MPRVSRDKSSRRRKTTLSRTPSKERRMSSPKSGKKSWGKILKLSFSVFYNSKYSIDDDRVSKRLAKINGKFGMKRVIKNGELAGYTYTFDFIFQEAFQKFLKEYSKYFSLEDSD